MVLSASSARTLGATPAVEQHATIGNKMVVGDLNGQYGVIPLVTAHIYMKLLTPNLILHFVQLLLSYKKYGAVLKLGRSIYDVLHCIYPPRFGTLAVDLARWGFQGIIKELHITLCPIYFIIYIFFHIKDNNSSETLFQNTCRYELHPLGAALYS